MIKAILFDMDNTLIDFMTMKKKCCEAAIDAMISEGLKTDKDKALDLLYELYWSYGLEYQKIFQKFLTKISGKIDYRILAHGIMAYRKIKEFYIIPYPRVLETLIELKKNYKLAIITDAPRIEAWLRLTSMNLEKYFDLVITAADVRKQKNNKAPFMAALRKLCVKPDESLMVGDRVDRDIKTAKELGIKTCFARYGDINKVTKGESGADYEIEDIKELLQIKNII